MMQFSKILLAALISYSMAASIAPGADCIMRCRKFVLGKKI